MDGTCMVATFLTVYALGEMKFPVCSVYSYIIWHFIDCSSEDEAKCRICMTFGSTLYRIGGELLNVKFHVATQERQKFQWCCHHVGLLQTNEEYSIDQLEHCYQVYSYSQSQYTSHWCHFLYCSEIPWFSPKIYCVRYIFNFIELTLVSFTFYISLIFYILHFFKELGQRTKSESGDPPLFPYFNTKGLPWQFNRATQQLC